MLLSLKTQARAGTDEANVFGALLQRFRVGCPSSSSSHALVRHIHGLFKAPRRTGAKWGSIAGYTAPDECMKRWLFADDERLELGTERRGEHQLR